MGVSIIFHLSNTLKRLINAPLRIYGHSDRDDK